MHFNLFCFLFVICSGCVSVQQQASENEDAEVKGFVGPLIVDQIKFNEMASSKVYDRLDVDDALLPSNNNITYEGTFDGKPVYIHNCKCLGKIKVVQDKLIVRHTYGGGGSDREHTKLLWNSKHYQNSKGEYVVDLLLYSDRINPGRALIMEEKKSWILRQ